MIKCIANILIVAMQYAFNDFGIRQVAQLLNKTSDEAYYANRVRRFPKHLEFHQVPMYLQ